MTISASNPFALCTVKNDASIEDGLFQNLDYKRKTDLTNPALEFPLTEAWNLELADLEQEKYYQKKDDEYFDSKWSNGLLRLSNFGCGVSMNIVVNGKEYGNIWVDDRCNDGGIFPDRYFGNEERITFLAWYELWLDQSLAEVAAPGYGEERNSVLHFTGYLTTSSEKGKSSEFIYI
jgi:hypothetical protein